MKGGNGRGGRERWDLYIYYEREMVEEGPGPRQVVTAGRPETSSEEIPERPDGREGGDYRCSWVVVNSV